MKQMLIAAIAVSFPLASYAAELPLKRVVLSTSGLAQFTYAGDASAGTALDLPVRLDQVDDLLKSLTIFDSAGAIGTIGLPGKAPLAELFRDLPFSQDALNSPSELLNALVGAEVEIEGLVNAKGRIFRVEDEKTSLPNNGGETVRHRLTLLSAKGFVQAMLEDVTALRFTDAQAKAQIDRALAGLAGNRAKDRRNVTIGIAGEGTRPVGFSYVVAAPVWKTSYRLVLPREGGKARLQGWGVIENLTGSDWKNVELSLVSGNPVALKQSLYSAYFVDRPEVAVSASMRLVPKTDDAEGDISAARQRSIAGAAKAVAPAPSSFGFGAPTRLDEPQATGVLDKADDIEKAALGVTTEEAATQVLYKLPATVSLEAGSTMMAAFADRDVSAMRTWLYQPDTNARRPLAAVRIANDTGSAMPAGIVTVFDRGADGAATFAGDARLPLLAAGEAKFVTFALDAKTGIRRTDRGIERTSLGKAVQGVLSLTIKSRRTIDYEITPPAAEDRDIVIDEVRSDGWKPVGEASGIELTPTRVRYKVNAAKGQTTKAQLTLERTDLQTVSLIPLEPQTLLATVSGLKNESAALKDAIARLSGAVTGINTANARRKDLEAERKKIADDQDRIRRNLSSVGQGSDLGHRYIDALREQEDRLAAIALEDKSAEADASAARKTAEDIARNLTL